MSAQTRPRRTPYSGPHDGELVRRAREGDGEAFGTLFRRHAGAVQAAVRDNVHDADTVADVIQESFTRALARLDTLRDPERFRPWLLSIARHAAVDQRRHRNRVGVLSDEAAEDLPCERTRPDAQAEVVELAALLDRGLAVLARRDATALSLVTHLGFGPSEVGAALGLTANASKVLVHRARRRLRDAVAVQVLLRARTGACPAFQAACDRDDLSGAARHVRACAACEDAAQLRLAVYDPMLARAAR